MTAPFRIQPLVVLVGGESGPGRALVSTLATQGFRTLRAAVRSGAFLPATDLEPDLVLIDATTSDVDAVASTEMLRDRTVAPIVVLLQRVMVDDRAAVLEAGANDYVTSPFTPATLLARVRVWVKQSARARSRRVNDVPGRHRLRIERDRVFVEGREVHLRPLERELLVTLTGRAMSEEQLISAVWGPKADRTIGYLRVCLRQLRQKIERDPSSPRYLVTDASGRYRLKFR